MSSDHFLFTGAQPGRGQVYIRGSPPTVVFVKARATGGTVTPCTPGLSTCSMLSELCSRPMLSLPGTPIISHTGFIAWLLFPSLKGCGSQWWCCIPPLDIFLEGRVSVFMVERAQGRALPLLGGSEACIAVCWEVEAPPRTLVFVICPSLAPIPFNGGVAFTQFLYSLESLACSAVRTAARKCL